MTNCISDISKEKTELTEKWPSKWLGNQWYDEKCIMAVVIKLIPVTLNTKYAKENNHQIIWWDMKFKRD